MSGKTTKIHLIYLLAIEFIHFNDYIYHFVYVCACEFMAISSDTNSPSPSVVAMQINFHIYKYFYKLEHAVKNNKNNPSNNVLNIPYRKSENDKGAHMKTRNILCNDSGYV